MYAYVYFSRVLLSIASQSGVYTTGIKEAHRLAIGCSIRSTGRTDRAAARVRCSDQFEELLATFHTNKAYSEFLIVC